MMLTHKNGREAKLFVGRETTGDCQNTLELITITTFLLLEEIHLILVPSVTLHFPFSENIAKPGYQKFDSVFLSCIKALKRYCNKVEHCHFLPQKPCYEFTKSTTRTYRPRELETYYSLEFLLLCKHWMISFYCFWKIHIFWRDCQFAIFSEDWMKSLNATGDNRSQKQPLVDWGWFFFHKFSSQQIHVKNANSAPRGNFYLEDTLMFIYSVHYLRTW